MTAETITDRRIRQHTHKPNGHVEGDTERCPWCGSEITRTEYQRIRKEISDRERARLAQLEQQATVKAKAETAAAVAKAKQEAAAAVTAKISKIEREKKAAEQKAKAAATEAKRLLDQQRKQMEQATDERVAAERERHAAEAALFSQQKGVLESQLADMARKLASRTANQLGEPAEVDLFTRLKTAFPTDLISRVRKGAKGPDVVIEVVSDGAVVGKVIVDSKNHSKWSSKFVSKLRADQREMNAAFAILSSNVYPSNKQAGVTKQPLQVVDGIIIADPSLVVAVAAILRQQVIDYARLRLGSEARSEKADALYALILSANWTDWFSEVLKIATEMSDLEQADAASYSRTHTKRVANIASLRSLYEAMAAAVARIINGDAP